MPRATLIGLLICLFLIACEADSVEQSEPQSTPESSQSPAPAQLQMCSENQRPEMCAQVYQPVCGQLKSDTREAAPEKKREGAWKTYGNACTACADHQVIGYKQGACDETTNE